MNLNQHQKQGLRNLPGVDRVLELAKSDPFFEGVPRSVLIRSIRSVLDDRRRQIIAQDPVRSNDILADTAVMTGVKALVRRSLSLNLRATVNATGIVIHTNLGRSLLAETAIDHLCTVGRRYSNLEFDLDKGRRGSRYTLVEDVICEISGAESAMVVNNNAGAVLLALETLAAGKKVIVSRGELVEIGGSFRIPDVMAKSGGLLCEVGTTNRTHLRDYESAIDERTALLLKVHKSNYSVVGFSAEVSLKELVELGRKHRIPVMEDLGSGTFIDFSRYGLLKEPTVQESAAAGADIVTFSGDKLLGGPQAGLMIGKKTVIDRIKKNPITRALRIDKLTLAALESTLRLYRDEAKAVQAIPTLRMMLQPITTLGGRKSRAPEEICWKAPGRSRLTVASAGYHLDGPAAAHYRCWSCPSRGPGVRISTGLLTANTESRKKPAPRNSPRSSAESRMSLYIDGHADPAGRRLGNHPKRIRNSTDLRRNQGVRDRARRNRIENRAPTPTQTRNFLLWKARSEAAPRQAGVGRSRTWMPNSCAGAGLPLTCSAANRFWFAP
ncbi:MAG: L-seryl-tRNA(Sec) selenium transferase [Deltaproteobacteria bacterium]|nr:L-seryl-tRNA(Sec) selenium transferase [Deltaproteobacteria bacterium]